MKNTPSTPETPTDKAASKRRDRRLVRLRDAIKEFHQAALEARPDLMSLEQRWLMDRAKPILEETEYHVDLALGEANEPDMP